MQRRDFLKSTGAIALVAKSANLFAMEQFQIDFKSKTYEGKNISYHHLTCPRNCRDACSMIAEDESDMYISWGSNESNTAVHWIRFTHRIKNVADA